MIEEEDAGTLPALIVTIHAIANAYAW